MITALLFTWFATAALLVVNALRSPVPPGKRFPPLWLPAMFFAEAAPWLFLGNLGAMAVLTLTTGFGSGLGQISFVLGIFDALGTAILMRRSLKAARDTGAEPSILDLWWRPLEIPEGVTVSTNVTYADGLTSIVYHRDGLEMAPALIYLHPGSWMRGRPGRQARPLIFGLAERGWVVLDISYPLSPAATFPDHLIGVKKAIAWAKSEGSKVGIDPSRVAISGGSSGAHLAALAALTASNTDLQPGFEEVDTSLIACVPHYGIFDLLIRNATRYDWPFIAKYVMKSTPSASPDLFKLGSPIDLVHQDAPPFLVIHGEHDSVVLPAESEHFVSALRDSGVDTTYHNAAGGQHGFDAFPSLRSKAVGALASSFLEKTAADVKSKGSHRDR